MNNITNEQFDSKLADILSDMTGAELLSIPGLYEVVAEELNNEVLEALEEGETLDKQDKQREIENVMYFLLTHNKNYTQKQYHALLELQELLG